MTYRHITLRDGVTVYRSHARTKKLGRKNSVATHLVIEHSGDQVEPFVDVTLGTPGALQSFRLPLYDGPAILDAIREGLAECLLEYG